MIAEVKMTEKMLVLFVCTGNTCRSPLAEALFNKYAAESGIPYAAESAGVHVRYSSEATENTVIAGRELDVDISAHRSRQADAETVGRASLIVCMNYHHKSLLEDMFGDIAEKTVLISAEGIPDPYGMSESAYRRMAADMDLAVNLLIDRLSQEVC